MSFLSFPEASVKWNVLNSTIQLLETQRKPQQQPFWMQRKTNMEGMTELPTPTFTIFLNLVKRILSTYLSKTENHWTLLYFNAFFLLN